MLLRPFLSRKSTPVSATTYFSIPANDALTMSGTILTCGSSKTNQTDTSPKVIISEHAHVIRQSIMGKMDSTWNYSVLLKDVAFRTPKCQSITPRYYIGVFNSIPSVDTTHKSKIKMFSLEMSRCRPAISYTTQ